jgi:hypothetical protein
MKIGLVLFFDGRKHRETVMISKFPATLGRDAQCDVVVYHPSVALKHATIGWKEAGPYLKMEESEEIEGSLEKGREIVLRQTPKFKLGDVDVEFIDTTEGKHVSNLVQKEAVVRVETKWDKNKYWQALVKFLTPRQIDLPKASVFAAYALLSILYLLFEVYLDDGFSDIDWKKEFLASFCALWFAMGGVNILYAVGLKVVRGKFHYLTVLNLNIKIFFILFWIDLVRRIFFYSINSDAIKGFLDLGFGIFTAILFFGSLIILYFPEVNKKKVVGGIVGLFALIVVSSKLWKHFDRKDHSYSLKTDFYLPLVSYQPAPQYTFSALEKKLLKGKESTDDDRKVEIMRRLKYLEKQYRNYEL